MPSAPRTEKPAPRLAPEQLESALLAAISEVSGELRRGRRPPPVSLDSSLERDLGLDSLARVELLSRIEAHFHAALPETVLAAAETPRDLLRALAAAPAPPSPGGAARLPPPSATGAEAAPPQARTLVDVLAWHAEHHPERPHLRILADEGEQVVTYRELLNEAESIAAGLQRLGIEPGRAVALMLPTSRAYFAGFFGVLLAGAVPVPIYPPARPSQLEDHVRRHRGILANARAAALITVPEAKGVARLLRAQAPALAHVRTVEELTAAGATFRPPRLGPADTAFLQYTSGSTGNPKGVVLTHANLLANIRVIGQAVNAEPDDVFVSWLPLYHDMGLIGAWLATLHYAVPLVAMSPLAFLSRPSRWLWAIHRHGATLSAAPNFGYELCLRRIAEHEVEGLDLRRLRVAFNGAEAVSPATLERFSRRFERFGFRREAMTPVYGLAESTLGLAFPPLYRGPRVDRIRHDPFTRTHHALPAAPEDRAVLRFVGCGHPLPGHEIRIVDTAGRELPERHEGALHFRGPSATSGYFLNPEATRALFADGWLDSGDLAYVADGEIFITGRRKDVIIHAGRNIYPDELEEAIGDVPGVRKGRVAVFGSPAPATGSERLVVLAETRETQPAARAALAGRINALALEHVGSAPDDVALVPPQTILKTSSGKIRRAAIREMYRRGTLGAARRPVAWQVARLAAGAALPEARALLSRAGAPLYAAYAWAAFALFAPLVWTLVVALPGLPRRWAVLRRAAHLFARAWRVPIAVHGLEHLPAPGRPCVLVANHASYLDGYALVVALPRHLSFVVKAEFRRSRVIGPFLRRIGAEFVERFDRARGVADARRLTRLAGAGRWLVYFPEGTFTRAPGLLPFHMGAFVAAAEAGVPVVPVTLRGTRSILRAGSWFPRRGAISVSIGAPVDPAAFEADAADTWARALRLRDAARAQIMQTSREPDLARREPAARQGRAIGPRAAADRYGPHGRSQGNRREAPCGWREPRYSSSPSSSDPPCGRRRPPPSPSESSQSGGVVSVSVSPRSLRSTSSTGPVQSSGGSIGSISSSYQSSRSSSSTSPSKC